MSNQDYSFLVEFLLLHDPHGVTPLASHRLEQKYVPF